jgi:uncharacterized protein YdeI (YjbR/CyaY-like superfamily)
MNTDPRIDQYILKAPEYAVPIMNHIRLLVHQACPEVTETMKWSFPHFDYKGSILCSMAAFKNHCAFNLWLGSLLNDPGNILATAENRSSMGQLGKIQKSEDLPDDDTFIKFLKETMVLIDKGVKFSRAPKEEKERVIEIPGYFQKVLEENEKAKITFGKFSYSHKKEYLEWITGAKTEDTRNKRIATAIEWLSEGKPHNWRYQK